MKEITNILDILNNLSQLRFAEKVTPQHYLPLLAVNDMFFNAIDYRNWVANHLKAYELNLYGVLAKCPKSDEEKYFAHIYEATSKTLFKVIEVDKLKAEMKEIPAHIEHPHEFELSCYTEYQKIKPILMRHLTRIAELKDFGVIGLNMDIEEHKLAKAYEMLVNRKIVEDNKELTFIASLTGKRVITNIKWADGANLARFFQGLKYEGIEFDALHNNRIDWNRIVSIFPLDVKGKTLTKSISSSTNSKSYTSDNYMQEVINNLQ